MKSWLYDWQGLNAWLFLQINGWHSAWLDAAMVWISWIGHYEHVTVFCAVYILAALAHLRHAAVRHIAPSIPPQAWLLHLAVVLLGYQVAVMLGEHMKDIWSLPRPYVALPAEMVARIDKVLPATQDWRAFPSGHSIFVAALVAGAWPVMKHWLRWIAVFTVLWMGISRISLGVHFPADVVYGWLVGAVVVWALRQFFVAYAYPVFDHMKTVED